jgi:hypothetical protein
MQLIAMMRGVALVNDFYNWAVLAPYCVRVMKTVMLSGSGALVFWRSVCLLGIWLVIEMYSGLET